MRFTVLMQSDDGTSEPTVLAQIDRSGPVTAATLGLTLAESKGMLAEAQRELVQAQFAEYLAAHRMCKACGGRRTIKDYHRVTFKSLFGSVALRVPRVFGCRCDYDPEHARTVKVEGLDN